MKVINRISELGNKFFEWVLKGIIPLPGIVKGVIVIVTFALVAETFTVSGNLYSFPSAVTTTSTL